MQQVVAEPGSPSIVSAPVTLGRGLGSLVDSRLPGACGFVYPLSSKRPYSEPPSGREQLRQPGVQRNPFAPKLITVRYLEKKVTNIRAW